MAHAICQAAGSSWSRPKAKNSAISARPSTPQRRSARPRSATPTAAPRKRPYTSLADADYEHPGRARRRELGRLRLPQQSLHRRTRSRRELPGRLAGSARRRRHLAAAKAKASGAAPSGTKAAAAAAKCSKRGAVAERRFELRRDRLRQRALGRRRRGDRRSEHGRRRLRQHARRTRRSRPAGACGAAPRSPRRSSPPSSRSPAARAASPFPAATLYAHLGEAGALYDVVSGHNGSCAGASACTGDRRLRRADRRRQPARAGAFALPGTPANTTPPAIAGVAEQGQTLTGHAGAWSGEPELDRASSGSAATPPAAAARRSPARPARATRSARQTSARRSACRRPPRNAAGQGAPAASAPTAAVTSDVPRSPASRPSRGITGSAVTIEGSGARRSRRGRSSAARRELHGGLADADRSDRPERRASPARSRSTGAGGSATSKTKFTPTLSLTGFGPQHGAAGRRSRSKGRLHAAARRSPSTACRRRASQYVSASKLLAGPAAGREQRADHGHERHGAARHGQQRRRLRRSLSSRSLLERLLGRRRRRRCAAARRSGRRAARPGRPRAARRSRRSASGSRARRR